jgi:undecaprenyl-diphosphatase
VAGVAVLLAGLGLLILGLSIVGAHRDDISPGEQRVFRFVNRQPRWLYGLLWLPMQLGNLVVGTVAGLAVAWWLEDWGVAVGVVAAMGLKLVAERVVRHRVEGFADVRQRPGSCQPGAILRGDVPERGASFPSGHVVLVAGIACVLATDLPASVLWVPWVLTLLVMVGRVYVGAHNPLDVTAGLGAGLLVGALIDLVLALS